MRSWLRWRGECVVVKQRLGVSYAPPSSPVHTTGESLEWEACHNLQECDPTGLQLCSGIQGEDGQAKIFKLHLDSDG